MLAFCQPVPVADNHAPLLSDAEWLASISWKEAAEDVQAAAQTGDVETFLKAWKRSLRRRLRRKSSAGRGDVVPALWSRYAFAENPHMRDWAHVLEHLGELERSGSRHKISVPPHSRAAGNGEALPKKKQRRRTRFAELLAACLERAASAQAISPDELLVLAELLSRPQIALHHDLLWKLWRTAFQAAVDLSRHLDEPAGSDAPHDWRLLVAGELPYRLGLLFADVKGAGNLRRRGRKALGRGLLDNTDSDGTPQAELLPRLPLWLAPLVRSADAAEMFGDDEFWSNKARERFESLVQVVAPLCRPDGRIALSNGSSHRLVSLLQSAARLAGFDKDAPPRTMLSAVERGAPRKKSRPSDIRHGGPLPAGQSDWARVARLRSDWSPAANSLVVAHHRQLPLIELSARGRSILGGPWTIEVAVGGEPVSLLDEWTCVCWYSDGDADYLELEMKLDTGLQIDRQLLLSRRDDFVLLADCVIGAGPRRIEYTSQLPLAEEIDVSSQIETRECLLKGNGVRARVFPLALPDNRVQSTAGGFGPYERSLLLKQVSAAEGLYAPLIIDWSPRRKRTPADWRTLTVTEMGRILPPGIAGGHRLRLGDHQLLIYRSLKKTDEHRSVLGHHTRHETVIGEFNGNGDVSPILMVE